MLTYYADRTAQETASASDGVLTAGGVGWNPRWLDLRCMASPCSLPKALRCALADGAADRRLP